MIYPVEWYAAYDCENILDVLKHVADFGVAIAAIEIRQFRGKELLDVGLIMPYCVKDNEKCYTLRAFNKMLCGLAPPTYDMGITLYHPPLSPYCPGGNDWIELEKCLYVPPYFYSIAAK